MLPRIWRGISPPHLMFRFLRCFLLACGLGGVLPVSLSAHVGSPHIVFQGRAGNFPVTVVVRQPDVVPGLVDIHVRVLEGQPTQVTALPMHASTGRNGAPRPDVAKRVEGETNLFTAQLWFMTRGAYGVEVAVQGEGGGGTLIVPVNSVALERRPMPNWLAGVACALLSLLAIGVICIAVAAARESTLPGDVLVGRDRRRWAWLGGVLGVMLIVGAIYGAQVWWKYEDDLHQTKVLFRPLEHAVSVEGQGVGTTLRLELTDARMASRSYRLLPDHGKWIHLFLVGMADPPAFAHLHPIRVGSSLTFTSAIPALPAGSYRLFADLTHEQGLTQTLTNRVELKAESTTLTTPVPGGPTSDEDDSWSAPTVAGEARVRMGTNLQMEMATPAVCRVGEPVTLDFRVVEDAGAAVALEPYLRMLGHAVVMREDGAVFSHVHPAGTLSMAAARKFSLKDGGEPAAKAIDVLCGDLSALPEVQVLALGKAGRVTFPFVFPSPGKYRIWVQVKVDGQIKTGSFVVRPKA